MEINVNVDSVNLTDVIEEYGERTLGDTIAAGLIQRIANSDHYQKLTGLVKDVRDQEIRAQLTPVIAEALAKPIKRTNTWGEPTGTDTTLREVIVDEARKWLNSKADDRYGSNNSETNLQKMIRTEVRDAFANEIADAVKAAREAVTVQLGQDIGERISGVVREALAKR